jgi:hypothetical protein
MVQFQQSLLTLLRQAVISYYEQYGPPDGSTVYTVTLTPLSWTITVEKVSQWQAGWNPECGGNYSMSSPQPGAGSADEKLTALVDALGKAGFNETYTREVMAKALVLHNRHRETP